MSFIENENPGSDHIVETNTKINKSRLPFAYVIFLVPCIILPIPVAARSKAWAFGPARAGILGSNSTGGMDVCLL
jgi:hypothetical protein